jgi:hypothetical protein
VAVAWWSADSRWLFAVVGSTSGCGALFCHTYFSKWTPPVRWHWSDPLFRQPVGPLRLARSMVETLSGPSVGPACQVALVGPASQRRGAVLSACGTCQVGQVGGGNVVRSPWDPPIRLVDWLISFMGPSARGTRLPGWRDRLVSCMGPSMIRSIDT